MHASASCLPYLTLYPGDFSFISTCQSEFLESKFLAASPGNAGGGLFGKLWPGRWLGPCVTWRCAPSSRLGEGQKLKQLFQTEALLHLHYLTVSHCSLPCTSIPRDGGSPLVFSLLLFRGTLGAQQQEHSTALCSTFPPSPVGTGQG